MEKMGWSKSLLLQGETEDKWRALQQLEHECKDPIERKDKHLGVTNVTYCQETDENKPGRCRG